MQFNNWIIYLLLAVVLVLIIILYWRLSTPSTANIEGFSSNNEKLGKIKSHNFNDFTIWTNRITAFLSTTPVAPISFWSPKLTTPATTGYFKLGDTLSTNNTYSKPTTDTILVKGDTIQPDSYNLLTKITNPALDNFTPDQYNYYTDLVSNITNFDDLSAISAQYSSILTLLTDMQDSIRNNMVTNVLSNIAVYRYYGPYPGQQRYTGTHINYNFNDGILANLEQNNSNLSIDGYFGNDLYSGPNLAQQLKLTKSLFNDIINGQTNTEGNPTITSPIPTYSNNTYSGDYVAVFPMGFKISYNVQNNDGTYNPIITISTPPEQINASASNNNSINSSINIKPNIPLNITDVTGIKINQNIVDYPISIPLSNLISMYDVRKTIKNVIYNLSNSINKILIDELEKSFDSIENYLQKVNITYHNYLNVVTCNKGTADAWRWSAPSFPYVLGGGEYQTNSTFISVDNALKSSVIDKVNTINFDWDIQNNIVLDFGLFLNKISNYVDILQQLATSKIAEIPLAIYQPVCSNPNYQALGDVVVNRLEDINNQNEYPTLACIPNTCVKDVRRWKLTDIVYENANPYFAIFYNPYTGTFKTTTTKGDLPDGMVQKVVSCIEGCKAVDKLVKSDQCAKEIAKYNKDVVSETPVVDTSATDEEDGYYLDRISRRENQLQTIKDGLNIIKLRSDQADSIAKAKSRQALQSYLDKQGANIDTVRSRLEKEGDTTVLNVKIPPHYKVDVVNKILDAVKNSNLPNKDDIIARIIASQRGKSHIVSKDDLNARMDDILSHCPDVNPNLIKKSVINSLCVGCNI